MHRKLYSSIYGGDKWSHNGKNWNLIKHSEFHLRLTVDSPVAILNKKVMKHIQNLLDSKEEPLVAVLVCTA